MNWTNKHDLPWPLATAIKGHEHKREGDVSVTQLIAPIQATVLRERYDAKITEDVSDHLWILLGHAVHYVIERASKDTLNEKLMLEQHLVAEVPFTEKRLSGTLDCYDTVPKAIEDWKVTGVYKVQKGKHTDWAKQLNVYRWLLMKAKGIVATTLRNQAIVRDWMKRETVKPDYPKIPFVTIEQPVEPLGEVENYIIERVRTLFAAKHVTDKELSVRFACSDEERWAKADMWAVVKRGGDRAMPGCIFDNPKQAFAVAKSRGEGFVVQYRPGEQTRCKDYCIVSEFCVQYRNMQKKPCIIGEEAKV